ncbi:hypothetical protein OROGR_019385 [Orobanche gracilis]
MISFLQNPRVKISSSSKLKRLAERKYTSELPEHLAAADDVNLST